MNLTNARLNFVLICAALAAPMLVGCVAASEDPTGDTEMTADEGTVAVDQQAMGTGCSDGGGSQVGIASCGNFGLGAFGSSCGGGCPSPFGGFGHGAVGGGCAGACPPPFGSFGPGVGGGGCAGACPLPIGSFGPGVGGGGCAGACPTPFGGSPCASCGNNFGGFGLGFGHGHPF